MYALKIYLIFAAISIIVGFILEHSDSDPYGIDVSIIASLVIFLIGFFWILLIPIWLLSGKPKDGLELGAREKMYLSLHGASTIAYSILVWSNCFG